MIRVFILVDSAVVRSDLENSFRGDRRFAVVGSGPNRPDTTVSEARGHQADVIVAAVPQGDVLSLPSFAGENPPIVLLADDLSTPQIRSVLHSGVKAVLSSDSSAAEIAAAIEAAAAGLTTLGRDIAETAFPANAADSSDSYGEKLTARESEVLGLLAEGVGNKEIAARLNLSEHTVKFHVSSILGKLGAGSRTEAVTEAIRRGLILV